MELAADCGRCVALCCVVPAFAASSEFAIDKPAHTPCPNLLGDHRCGIHAHLRQRGFSGCTAYDCFGAGQHVTAATAADQRYAVFPVMVRLHEFLWYLSGSAQVVPPHAALRRELRELRRSVKGLVALDADELSTVDLESLAAQVGQLLGRVSAHVRGDAGADLRRADLAGVDLRARDLRRADLRGAVLLGADLRRVDLDGADLLGADLRGARVHGADLGGALFLTRTQLGGMHGDPATRLPPTLERPRHWR